MLKALLSESIRLALANVSVGDFASEYQARRDALEMESGDVRSSAEVAEEMYQIKEEDWHSHGWRDTLLRRVR